MSKPRAQKSPLPPLTDTEIRIFLALIRLGAASAPELARHLTKILPQTVYTLLQRMAAKGIIESNYKSPVRQWSARQELIDSVLAEDVRRTVQDRYGSDPTILRPLLLEIQQALKESKVTRPSRRTTP
jgi:predicted transcriptional regulator